MNTTDALPQYYCFTYEELDFILKYDIDTEGHGA
jgi:hypothetical protein